MAGTCAKHFSFFIRFQANIPAKAGLAALVFAGGLGLSMAGNGLMETARMTFAPTGALAGEGGEGGGDYVNPPPDFKKRTNIRSSTSPRRRVRRKRSTRRKTRIASKPPAQFAAPKDAVALGKEEQEIIKSAAKDGSFYEKKKILELSKKLGGKKTDEARNEILGNFSKDTWARIQGMEYQGADPKDLTEKEKAQQDRAIKELQKRITSDALLYSTARQLQGIYQSRIDKKKQAMVGTADDKKLYESMPLIPGLSREETRLVNDVSAENQDYGRRVEAGIGQANDKPVFIMGLRRQLAKDRKKLGTTNRDKRKKARIDKTDEALQKLEDHYFRFGPPNAAARKTAFDAWFSNPPAASRSSSSGTPVKP